MALPQCFVSSFQRIERLDCQIRGRCKAGQVFKLPEILGVELAAVIMGDRPDRADGFPLDVKRHEQALFDWWGDRQEIGVTPFDVPEQQRSVAIEHVTARAKVARCAAANVGFPRPANGRPVEPLSAIFFGEQTDTG